VSLKDLMLTKIDKIYLIILFNSSLYCRVCVSQCFCGNCGDFFLNSLMNIKNRIYLK